MIKQLRNPYLISQESGHITGCVATKNVIVGGI
jgi:hypothetical protein